MTTPTQPVVRPWKRREPIRAKRSNETVEAVNSLLRGANGGRQVSPVTAAGVAMRRFRVKSVGTDVIVCRGWDGVTEGSVDIDVALPYLLRRTPFDGLSRDGISYVYTSNTERTATDGSDNETQVITPSYTVDDEIFAVKRVSVLGGIGEDSSGAPLADWLIDENDGRAWAAI